MAKVGRVHLLREFLSEQFELETPNVETLVTGRPRPTRFPPWTWKSKCCGSSDFMYMQENICLLITARNTFLQFFINK